MKNLVKMTAVSCIASSAALMSSASAQILDFNVTVDKPERALGSPTLLRIAPTFNADGTVDRDTVYYEMWQFPGGVDSDRFIESVEANPDELWITNYFTDGFGVSGIDTLSIVRGGADFDISAYTPDPSSVEVFGYSQDQLFPASPAETLSAASTIDDYAGFASFLLDDDGGLSSLETTLNAYEGNCGANVGGRGFVFSDGSAVTGGDYTNALTGEEWVFGRCDALDAQFKIDGIDISLFADADSTFMTLLVPAANIDFTNFGNPFDLDVVDAFAISNRSDFEDQLFDYLQADNNAKGNDFAAALLGVSLVDLPAIGSLPQGGDFFGIDATFTRAGFNTDADQKFVDGSFAFNFGASSLGEVLAYALINPDSDLDTFGLGALDDLNDTDGANVTLTALGISATAVKEENDPNITLTSSDLGINFTTTNALDFDDAVSQVETYLEENEDRLIENATQFYQEDAIATDPTNGIAGNPTSVQGVLTASLLSLDSPSSLLMESTSDLPGSESEGESDDEGSDGSSSKASLDSSWMVGGRVGTLQTASADASFVDVAFERGFRVGENSRDRIKISVPVTYLKFDDVNQTTGSIRVGYEHQIIDGKWIVEPSVGAGYSFSDGEVLAGQAEAGALWALGLASRYKIAPVGKGHIVIGNAVGYSNTFDIQIEGSFQSPKISNTHIRNGIAYQVPVGERIFGRMGTLRTSYTHTLVEGDEVAVDEYHDISFNYGVGSRESTIRSFAETFRVGFSTTLGKDYEAYSITAGFKF